VNVLSVVLPVYNERENLEVLVARLLPVLEQCGEPFEIVFIDDGSRDGSGDALDALHTSDARIKVVHLSRNYGHQAALQAGLDHASGDAVVMMDADLQDPPELLSQFVAAWRAGHEVVYAVRRKRQEGALKRLAYAAFYRTMRMAAEIDVPLDAGDFCLLDRRVVDALATLPEHNRFLRGLRSWVGFRQIGIEYERGPRHAGDPKYTLRKLVRLALSGYIGFSSMPLRVAGWVGLIAAMIGFGIALWIVYTKLVDIPSPRGWASLMAVMLVIAGTQLLVLGVLGEYLGRVYDEVRRRPLYIARSRVGFERSPRNPKEDCIIEPLNH
jgi:dolichol-phosphate mannosyltransferase